MVRSDLYMSNVPRRNFLKIASAGLSAAVPAVAQTAKPRVLTENDRVEIGERGPEIIDRAYQAGRDLEKQYGGCARCTVAALQDALDFVPASDEVVLASSCLDGGATTTKLANCGAFTGAGMVIGQLCGTTRENFAGHANLAHELIREVHGKFVAAYGSVLCSDIRQMAGGDCPEVVGKAARWTAETLLKRFAG